MKVYRIKHKPSGLYYNELFRMLDKEGTVLDCRYDLSEGLLIWDSNPFTTPWLEWSQSTIPESELEVKEYDLED